MSATTFVEAPGQGPSVYRVLGWGASALLHGGALAFLLYGMPAPHAPSAPDVIPLEMIAPPAAPAVEETPPEPVMEQVQAVAPEATSAAVVPPPPAVTTTAEPLAAAPPPEPLAATPPPDLAPAPPVDTLRAVEPEVQQAVEPDSVPLEAADIPPPPPAPPPPPVQARAPAPPPPRPAPRREAPPVAAPPQPVQRSEAPPGPVTASPTPAPPGAEVVSRAASAPPSNYQSLVSQALNRAKRYPQRARLRRVEGTGLLSFTMRRDGTLLNWRLVRSTGDADLDEAVGEMIQRARLPPLPPDVAGDTWSPTVPVSFNVN